MSRALAPLLQVAWAGALLLAPGSALGREYHPYLDVAFGVGVGALDTELAPEGQDELVGFPLKLDVRLFLPSNHGAGLAVSFVEEPNLLGGSSPSAIFVDALYAFRGSPERGFHIVPALFVGPSYLHYDAVDDPESVELEARDHHALGGVAGLSLDFHGEVLFGGLELTGRYAIPIADEVAVRDGAGQSCCASASRSSASGRSPTPRSLRTTVALPTD